MKLLWILLIIIVFLILLFFLITYICYRMAFFVSAKSKIPKEEYPIPVGAIYEPYRDLMVQWIKETREMKYEEVSITSFDGLKLYGKYYEYSKEAPIELMFHGYRGNAERDLCGGVQRCVALKRNVLIVDQRTSGKSEGHVISFGINESKDCLDWIDFIIEHFGSDKKIILTGISMGASTVMLAAGKDLPKNVISILADCGYSDAKSIIKKVIRQMNLPDNLLYPFVKAAARIYGHFDLEETSCIESMRNCKIPVLFFHGEGDDFVPCEMSRICYEACAAPKMLVTVPDTGHGLCFLKDTDGYFKAVEEFSRKYHV